MGLRLGFGFAAASLCFAERSCVTLIGFLLAAAASFLLRDSSSAPANAVTAVSAAAARCGLSPILDFGFGFGLAAGLTDGLGAVAFGAGRARAARFDGLGAVLEPRVPEVDAAGVGVRLTVTARAAGQHAIEQIDAPADRFHDVDGVPHTHQVPHLVARQSLGSHGCHVQQVLASLADGLGRAADGEVSALRHDPVGPGLSMEVKGSGGTEENRTFEVVIWLDLVRMNPAMKSRAVRGRHQAGMRMHVTAASLRDFATGLAAHA